MLSGFKYERSFFRNGRHVGRFTDRGGGETRVIHTSFAYVLCFSARSLPLIRYLYRVSGSVSLLLLLFLSLFFLRFSASRSSVAESVASHNRAAGVASPPPPRRGAQFLAPVDRATGGRPFGWQQTLPPPVTVADKMHPKRLSYFPPSPRSLALAKSLTPRLSGRIEPRHWISRIPELFQTPFFLAKSERERRRPLLFLSLSE